MRSKLFRWPCTVAAVAVFLLLQVGRCAWAMSGSDPRTSADVAFDPTTLGVWAFYLYPVFVLLGDAFLKFGLGDMTISERIWEHVPSRIAACSYIAVLGTVLFLHLGFMFLPG